MEYVGKSKSAKKKKKPVLWIVLSIVAIIQIFPLIWLLDFSLASSNEMFTSGLLIIPKKSSGAIMLRHLWMVIFSIT